MDLAEKIINGMCCTYHHGFGLLNSSDQGFIRGQMEQLYEHNVKTHIDRLTSSLAEREKEITRLTSLLSERDAEIATLKDMVDGHKETIGAWVKSFNLSEAAVSTAHAEGMREAAEIADSHKYFYDDDRDYHIYFEDAGDKIRDAIPLQAKTGAKEDVCEWKRLYKESLIWEAKCGFSTIYNGLTPDGTCKCGKPIKIKEDV